MFIFIALLFFGFAVWNLYKKRDSAFGLGGLIGMALSKYVFKQRIVIEGSGFQSKNNSIMVWLLIPFFLVIDFIAIGFNPNMFPIVALPTIAGAGFAALVFWLGNKDMVVYIIESKLVLKKNNSEIREFTKDEITSYRISKDQGKTTIRIYLNNKNEYELSSYFLDLNGFEKHIDKLLNKEYKDSTPSIKQEVIDNSNDIPSQIEKLANLKEKGILSDEEFTAKKKELLDKM